MKQENDVGEWKFSKSVFWHGLNYPLLIEFVIKDWWDSEYISVKKPSSAELAKNRSEHNL